MLKNDANKFKIINLLFFFFIPLFHIYPRIVENDRWMNCGGELMKYFKINKADAVMNLFAFFFNNGATWGAPKTWGKRRGARQKLGGATWGAPKTWGERRTNYK